MTNERESAQCLSQIGLSLTTDTFARKHPWRLLLANRELKQQWRWRLTKRHLKSEFALLQTLSRLFHLVYFVKCWQMFLELNSKGLYQSSGKEKESCCLVFHSSKKHEIRYFHVVVVQQRLTNVQKSMMHVQSCYFANLNLLVFRCFCCHRCRCCLSSLIY